MYPALRVHKEEAEKIRKFTEKIRAKDRNRLIIQNGEFIEIPIYDKFLGEFSDYTIVEQTEPFFKKKSDLYTILKKKLPKEAHKFIPRRYKIIGDIILIKLPEELKKYYNTVGDVILSIHPRCKSVWRDGGKRGMLRIPDVELIAGSGSETIHRENGCQFKLDITKVMFSPGNHAERSRMGRIAKKGESVVDMFAGIGYFSIPVAVNSKPHRVYSIEINPDSYHFLLENIKINDVHRIIPILGDSQVLTPEGIADRVIMGHINCARFLPTAVRALKEDGGVVHYHESTPEALLNRPLKRVRKACEEEGRKANLKLRKVKHYSPGVLHVVVDAIIH